MLSVVVVELHERIRAWREYSGLKVTDVAAKLKLTPNAVHFWERDPSADDATSPSRAHLDAFIGLIGITMVQFWGRVPKRARAS